MNTVEAIYDNWKLIFKKPLKTRKAKVLITFIEEIDNEETETVKFPVSELGKILSIDTNNLYDEYISDRY